MKTKYRRLSVLLYIAHIPSAEQNFGSSTVLPLFPKPAHKNFVHKRVYCTGKKSILIIFYNLFFEAVSK